MVYSEQHRIINHIVISFKNKKTTYTKVSFKQLDQDLLFYNPDKYKFYTLEDFTFLVLWTVFKNNTNRIDTLKTLRGYQKEELRDIRIQKDKFTYHEKTKQEDITYLNTKIVTRVNLSKMYQNKDITELGYYHYMSNLGGLTRIERRTFDRVHLFLDLLDLVDC